MPLFDIPLNEFGLSEKSMAIINEIYSRFPQIEKVICYGSRAKGNFREGSDIDMAIIAGDGFTDRDFALVNAALFPNGADELEIYEWDTDWSDYFNDGREWWGTLCLTVYDGTLRRFAVITASATD